MPLLSFDAKTKDDLTICKTIKADFFAQFCKIALDFLKGGANQKMLKGAGQKLKVKPEDVEVAVIIEIPPRSASYIVSTICSLFRHGESSVTVVRV